MFEVSGVHKMVEKDNFLQGCIGSYHDAFIPGYFKSNDIDSLIRQIGAEFGCSYAATVAACGELNRIDFSSLEDDGGDAVSKDSSLYARWEAGEIDLWAATYTVYVEVVERRDAVLAEREVEL